MLNKLLPKLIFTNSYSATTSKHIWEIDFGRGIAVILMIYFHLMFDLADLYNMNINYRTGIIFVIGRIAGITFIVVSGISCQLANYRDTTYRGMRIFAWGMLITLITSFTQFSIKFGILHLLGIAIISSVLFKRVHQYIVCCFALLILLLPEFIHLQVSNNYFFILGFRRLDFFYSDYYPIIPWYGYFLFGIAFAKFFYSAKKSIISHYIKDPISKIGTKSLLIYLIHQPIILSILYCCKLLHLSKFMI
jgi:uncharacterized membrane protein